MSWMVWFGRNAMSDTVYLKCPCQKCGGVLEFPADGVGDWVDCPHCGAQTKLEAVPEPARETHPAKSGRRFPGVAATLLLAPLLVVLVLIWNRPKLPDSPTVPSTTKTQTATNTTPLEVLTEMNEFKLSKFILKKSENGGLVYATGTVKNDTSRQRFGVKIELDLYDAQDAKVGSASDYIAVLEPFKEWRFNALLAEPKAVEARLVNVAEQK
jgi:hypothetical protein